MKLDLSKVTEVSIIDHNKEVIDRFTLSSATFQSLSGLLSLQKGKQLSSNPICKITNDKFGWVLEVDGRTIVFGGESNALYLGEMYSRFGYSIEWDRDKWKRDE